MFLDFVVAKLRDLVCDKGFVLIHAPQEYEPGKIAEQLMNELHGDGNYLTRHLEDSRHIEGLIENQTDDSTPLLVYIDDDEEICRKGPYVAPIHKQISFNNQIIAVLTCDDNLGALAISPDLVLDHNNLTLTLEDADINSGQLAGLAIDEQQWRNLLSDTGGVPRLFENYRIGDDDQSVARQIADSWLKRIFERIRGNEILELHIWTGDALAETLCQIIEDNRGSAPSLRDIEQVRSQPLITYPRVTSPHMPRLVAQAARVIYQQEAPERAEQFVRWIRNTAINNDLVPGLERIRLISYIQDWAELDRLFATRATQMLYPKYAERRDFLRLWPRSTQLWPRLNRVQRLLAGLDLIEFSAGTPATWIELHYLSATEDDPRPGTPRALVVEIMKSLVPRGRLFDYEYVKERLYEIGHIVTKEVDEIINQPDALAHGDDLALLSLILEGAADFGIRSGEMEIANLCNNTSNRIMMALGPNINGYRTLRPLIALRSAMLAVLAGLPQLARERIKEYRFTIRADEPYEMAMARAVERLIYVLPQELLADPDPQTINVEEAFAPHLAEAEVIRIALLKGQNAAILWGQSTLNRARWAATEPWEYWPLRATLAALLAIEGSVRQATKMIQDVRTPNELRLCVQALIDYSELRLDSAVTKANQVIENEKISNRWRLLAVGTKLACLADEGDNEIEIETLIGAENWINMLGVVALFPRKARELIADNLGDQLMGLVGVSSADQNKTQQPQVKLTPRQNDVLALLAEGMTMTQIAERLYISVETVRSTSKTLYKRLKVHGRDAAVRAGKMMGFIS